MTLAKANGTPVRKAGGDNEVKRNGRGQPLILSDCDTCAATGKVPSEKVAGRLNQCPSCKGEGKRERAFTRVTTLADTLEDKENLIAWKSRMTLLGAAMDPSFLDGLLSLLPEESKEDKDALTRRAEAAAEHAGTSRKADHGTLLHGYTELIDEGIPLPDGIDLQDWADVNAYYLATKPLFNIVHMEQLVICDELGTAGTPDRISSVVAAGPLVSPDGHVFGVDELLITDLKTGRVDLGGLKMAMQLATYAHSKLYDKVTGERVELGNVNQDWGVIFHLAAGSGRCDLYWIDLRLGWEALQVAVAVRKLRSRGRKAMEPVVVAAMGDLNKEAA